jgi:hypothetical protein
MKIGDLPVWSNPVYNLRACQLNSMALQYITDQTEEMCLTSVKKNPMALKYVKNQTEEICLVAIGRYGFKLEYVKNPTEVILLAALRRYPHLFRQVSEIRRETMSSKVDET